MYYYHSSWLAALAFLTGAHTFAAQPRYTVVDLGTLGADESSYAWSIGQEGQVAGWSTTGGNGTRRAFLWTSSTGMKDLGTLGGAESFAWGISTTGKVSGQSTVPSSNPPIWHAFLWTPVDGMKDIGTLGGNLSIGRAINAIGQVVGESLTAAQRTHAFLWSAATGMKDLGTLGGGDSSGLAINNAGQVAGWAAVSDNASFTPHAFLWDGMTMRDLGTLGSSYSQAYGLNDVGEVVGGSHLANNTPSHAFSWSASGGGIRDLGPLGGVTCNWASDVNRCSSWAYAISNVQQVVGYSTTATDPNLRAVLWHNGSVYDLNAFRGPFERLYIATAINDHGQIAGYGIIGGRYHAFRLDPAIDSTPPLISGNARCAMCSLASKWQTDTNRYNQCYRYGIGYSFGFLYGFWREQ